MPSQGGEFPAQTGVLRSRSVVPQMVLTPQESSQKRPCTVLSSRGGRSHEPCLLQRLRIPTGYDGELPSCENSARAECPTGRPVSIPIGCWSTWASTTHAVARRVTTIIVHLGGDGNRRAVDGTERETGDRGRSRVCDGGNSHWVALPSRQVFAIMCDESTVEVMMTMLARRDLQMFAFGGAIEGTWLPMPHV